MMSEDEMGKVIADAVRELCMRAIANSVYDIVMEELSGLSDDEKKGVFFHIIDKFDTEISKMNGGLNVEEK